MSELAQTSPPFVLVTPEVLSHLIERLPAQQRANLRWLPRHLENVLSPLLESPVTRQTSLTVASALWQQVMSKMQPEIHELFRSVAPDSWLAEFEAAATRDRNRLEAVLSTPVANRAARRVIMTVTTIGSMGVELLRTSPELLHPPSELSSEIERELASGEPAFLRLAALHMALVCGAQQKADPDRLETLSLLADATGLELAGEIDGMPDGFSLPWYLADDGTERYREIALVQEEPAYRSQLLALAMEGWGDEDDAQAWPRVADELERNHSSARRLFR